MLLHYPKLINGVRAVSSKPVSKGQSFVGKKPQALQPHVVVLILALNWMRPQPI